jgi:nicotinate-nucleotide adenylyltransferase
MIHPGPFNGADYRWLRIGLLGGSFNPAHEGHLLMSQEAMRHLGLDQVWWLVSPQNPLKSNSGMRPLAERIALARIMAARRPKIIVTSLEQALGTRYTTDTLRALRQRFPAARFVWLLGTDNWQQLPRWRHWQTIIQQVPIAVLQRPGYAGGMAFGKASSRWRRQRLPATAALRLATSLPPTWCLLNNRRSVMSATAIRRQRKE